MIQPGMAFKSELGGSRMSAVRVDWTDK